MREEPAPPPSVPPLNLLEGVGKWLSEVLSPRSSEEALANAAEKPAAAKRMVQIEVPGPPPPASTEVLAAPTVPPLPLAAHKPPEKPNFFTWLSDKFSPRTPKDTPKEPPKEPPKETAQVQPSSKLESGTDTNAPGIGTSVDMHSSKPESTKVTEPMEAPQPEPAVPVEPPRVQSQELLDAVRSAQGKPKTPRSLARGLFTSSKKLAGPSSKKVPGR